MTEPEQRIALNDNEAVEDDEDVAAHGLRTNDTADVDTDTE
jgi:hypothetical protein